MSAYVHVYTCMKKPEVNVRGLPLLLSTLVFEYAFLVNLELPS